ncbi:MAG TPA: TlpA disulfide reductase family protein [Verrucomicrobiae bacterium]|nr:TlpA disulfide reductase family protein [Verrucomicrobiae bacterium]
MRWFLSLFVCLTALALPVQGTDLPEFKTADDLWGHIQKTLHDISTANRVTYVVDLEELRTSSLEFERRYPTDARHWDAKFVRLQAEFAQAAIANRKPDVDALVASLKEIAAAPDASATLKTNVNFFSVTARLHGPDAPESFSNATARAALDADITALRKNYPNELRTAILQLSWVDVLKTCDPDRAEAILRDLAGHKDPRVASDAQQQLKTLQMQRKLAREPLDLKFKAVDGTEVDLAKLRGKVVLLDFWAVWCTPCRMEIPNILATYNQFHGNGFEIVGVSLDHDKDKLIDFTKQTHMTWPQYFDGKMWSNEISSRFGIESIPALWLIDKKGFLRSTDARGSELAEQVKKLLAE